jgi:hypothetical protein
MWAPSTRTSMPAGLFPLTIVVVIVLRGRVAVPGGAFFVGSAADSIPRSAMFSARSRRAVRARRADRRARSRRTGSGDPRSTVAGPRPSFPPGVSSRRGHPAFDRFQDPVTWTFFSPSCGGAAGSRRSGRSARRRAEPVPAAARRYGSRSSSSRAVALAPSARARRPTPRGGARQRGRHRGAGALRPVLPARQPARLGLELLVRPRASRAPSLSQECPRRSSAPAATSRSPSSWRRV